MIKKEYEMIAIKIENQSEACDFCILLQTS